MGLAYDTADDLRAAAQRTAAGADPSQPGLVGRTLRGVSNALWYLDTPGAVVRSAIDYGMDGQWNNPLDAAQRVSPDDIAERAFGVSNPVGKFVLGTAVGVATDPLTYLAGPLKALTPAGKAARAAGLLDDAAEVASRQLQDRAARGMVTDLPGRAKRTLRALGRDSIDNFTEHSARPLVGQRAAQRQVTLRQLVDRVKDPDQAARLQQHLQGYLSKKRLTYGDIADTPLSGSWGFGGLVGDPLGATVGDASARFFDAVGESVRWSPVGRLAHKVSNKLTGGTLDPISQAAATEINTAGNAGASAGAREAGDVAQLIQFAEVPDAVARRTGISDAKGVDAAEAIDRYLEGVAATPRDIDFVENTPKIREFVEKWGVMRSDLLDKSKTAGINAHQLRHKFGAAYRPYMMTTALDREILQQGASKGGYFDLSTGDMIRRKKFLQLPGGIDQLRYYAKKKEFLGGRDINPATGQRWTDDEVANWLVSDINNPTGEYYSTVQGSEAALYPARAAAAKGLTKKQRNTVGVLSPDLQTPMVTKGQTRQIAKFLNQLDPADPVVFGNHPAEAVARYTTGRMRAIATGEALADSVISRAVAGSAGANPGGKAVSLRDALARVGLKSQRTAGSQLAGGAAARAREAIAEKLQQQGRQVRADDVDLSSYFVPESFIDRLTKAQNLVSAPKESGPFGNLIREMNRAFKAQALARPARITRDWLSGIIGNFITVGDPRPLVQSMWHSQSLLDGNYDRAIGFIRGMPAYANVGGDEATLKAYLSDLAEAGVLKGMGGVEREIGDRTGKALLEVLPGSTPLNVPIPNAQTVTDIVADKNSLDLFGVKGVSIGNRPRTWGQYAKDSYADPLGVTSSAPDAVVRRTTNNPIFRKFEDAGEWSDAHTRLSGYNAMLAQGVSPKEAARRLKDVHVDYESLTEYEKQLRDTFVPFLAYTLRSGQYAAKEMLNPGGPYAQVIKGLDRLQGDDDEAYLPQTYRERGAFGIAEDTLRSAGVPDALNFAAAPEGMSSVFSGVDIPGMSALNMLSYKPSAAGAVDSISASANSTAQNMLSQMSPVVKAVAETATGVDSHTKRPIGAVPTQWDKVLIGATGNKDARLPAIAKHALDIGLPGLGPSAGLVGTALDPRLDPLERTGQAAWNAIMPVRRNFVDDSQRRRDELAVIDEMISRVPGNRTFSKTTLPDEVVATLPPEFQALVARKKQIEKEMRTEAKSVKTPEGRAKRFRSTRTKRQPQQAG